MGDFPEVLLILSVSKTLALAATSYLDAAKAARENAASRDDDDAGSSATEHAVDASSKVKVTHDTYYEGMRFELQFLGRGLQLLYTQGRRPDNCIGTLEKVAKMLDGMLSISTLDDILAKMMLVAAQSLRMTSGASEPGIKQHLEGPLFNRYPNLQKLRACLTLAPSHCLVLDPNSQLLLDNYFRKEKRGPKLMRRLKKCNAKLEELIPDPADADSIDRVRIAKRFNIRRFKDDGSVRKQAYKLHGLLHATWPCSCSALHDATLGSALEARLRLGPNWNSGGVSPIEFDLLLLSRNRAKQECRICLEASNATLSQIVSPCHFSNAAGDGLVLRLATDSDGKLCAHAPSSSRSKLAVNELEEITLRELILEEADLSYMQKRVLAVILASSVLHLHGGPWLSSTWNKEHVSFFYRLTSQAFDVTHPYLSTKFVPSTPGKDKADENFHRLHQYPSILALGILLLEIELGDRLSKIYEGPGFQRYLGNQNANADLFRAEDLLKECKKRFRPDTGYVRSIEYCLNRDFLGRYANSGKTYDDWDFLEAIYAHIIYPLEEELLSGSNKDLDALVSALTTDEVCTLVPCIKKVALETFSLAQRHMPTPFENTARHSETLETIEEDDLSEGSMEFTHLKSGESGACHVIDSGDLVSASIDRARWANGWFKMLIPVRKLVKSAQKLPLTKDDKEKMVRVAVLDTGIDLSHPGLKRYIDSEQISDYWDFVENCKPIKDTSGHGTHTAHLLLKTAWNPKLFVARVFRTTTADADTAGLVAKAIRHAVDEWNVDIISMSFAFTDEDFGIGGAIQYASTKDVLLFAAASNNKANEKNPIGYPARVREYVICVNSSSFQDEKSSFSPKGQIGRDNFSVVGEGVTAAWPMSLGDTQELRVQHGTSCATPIAAGVAALVLEYSRQKALPEIQNVSTLHTIQGMTKVLWEMTDKSKDGSYNYIRPWLLLEMNNPQGTSSRITQLLKNPHSRN